MKKVCIKCGENEIGIRKHHMICGSVDSLTGELDQEWGRHRFKPYSAKELKDIKDSAEKEDEYWQNLAKESETPPPSL